MKKQIENALYNLYAGLGMLCLAGAIYGAHIAIQASQSRLVGKYEQQYQELIPLDSKNDEVRIMIKGLEADIKDVLREGFKDGVVSPSASNELSGILKKVQKLE